MAGYHFWSKSNNAIAAEADGRFPLTLAIPLVAKAAGVSRAAARAALLEVGSREWHHTSKKYNRTAYFDTADAIRLIEMAPVMEKLKAAGMRKRVGDVFAMYPGESGLSCRQLEAGLDAAFTLLAAEVGCTAEIARDCYYA